MNAGLEQKDLCKRWGGVSLDTVRRVVHKYLGDDEPIEYRGLRPIFSPAQADRMFAEWQDSKKTLVQRISRKVKKHWRERRAGRVTSAKVLSLDEVKRRAAR